MGACISKEDSLQSHNTRQNNPLSANNIPRSLQHTPRPNSRSNHAPSYTDGLTQISNGSSTNSSGEKIEVLPSPEVDDQDDSRTAFPYNNTETQVEKRVEKIKPPQNPFNYKTYTKSYNSDGLLETQLTITKSEPSPKTPDHMFWQLKRIHYFRVVKVHMDKVYAQEPQLKEDYNDYIVDLHRQTMYCNSKIEEITHQLDTMPRSIKKTKRRHNRPSGRAPDDTSSEVSSQSNSSTSYNTIPQGNLTSFYSHHLNPDYSAICSSTGSTRPYITLADLGPGGLAEAGIPDETLSNGEINAGYTYNNEKGFMSTPFEASGTPLTDPQVVTMLNSLSIHEQRERLKVLRLHYLEKVRALYLLIYEEQEQREWTRQFLHQENIPSLFDQQKVINIIGSQAPNLSSSDRAHFLQEYDPVTLLIELYRTYREVELKADIILALSQLCRFSRGHAKTRASLNPQFVSFILEVFSSPIIDHVYKHSTPVPFHSCTCFPEGWLYRGPENNEPHPASQQQKIDQDIVLGRQHLAKQRQIFHARLMVEMHRYVQGLRNEVKDHFFLPRPPAQLNKEIATGAYADSVVSAFANNYDPVINPGSSSRKSKKDPHANPHHETEHTSSRSRRKQQDEHFICTASSTQRAIDYYHSFQEQVEIWHRTTHASIENFEAHNNGRANQVHYIHAFYDLSESTLFDIIMERYNYRITRDSSQVVGGNPIKLPQNVRLQYTDADTVYFNPYVSSVRDQPHPALNIFRKHAAHYSQLLQSLPRDQIITNEYMQKFDEVHRQQQAAIAQSSSNFQQPPQTHGQDTLITNGFNNNNSRQHSVYTDPNYAIMNVRAQQSALKERFQKDCMAMQSFNADETDVFTVLTNHFTNPLFLERPPVWADLVDFCAVNAYIDEDIDISKDYRRIESDPWYDVRNILQAGGFFSAPPQTYHCASQILGKHIISAPHLKKYPQLRSQQQYNNPQGNDAQFNTSGFAGSGGGNNPAHSGTNQDVQSNDDDATNPNHANTFAPSYEGAMSRTPNNPNSALNIGAVHKKSLFFKFTDAYLYEQCNNHVDLVAVVNNRTVGAMNTAFDCGAEETPRVMREGDRYGNYALTSGASLLDVKIFPPSNAMLRHQSQLNPIETDGVDPLHPSVQPNMPQQSPEATLARIKRRVDATHGTQFELDPVCHPTSVLSKALAYDVYMTTTIFSPDLSTHLAFDNFDAFGFASKFVPKHQCEHRIMSYTVLQLWEKIFSQCCDIVRYMVKDFYDAAVFVERNLLSFLLNVLRFSNFVTRLLPQHNSLLLLHHSGQLPFSNLQNPTAVDLANPSFHIPLRSGVGLHPQHVPQIGQSSILPKSCFHILLHMCDFDARHDPGNPEHSQKPYQNGSFLLDNFCFRAISTHLFNPEAVNSALIALTAIAKVPRGWMRIARYKYHDLCKKIQEFHGNESKVYQQVNAFLEIIANGTGKSESIHCGYVPITMANDRTKNPWHLIRDDMLKRVGETRQRRVDSSCKGQRARVYLSMMSQITRRGVKNTVVNDLPLSFPTATTSPSSSSSYKAAQPVQVAYNPLTVNRDVDLDDTPHDNFADYVAFLQFQRHWILYRQLKSTTRVYQNERRRVTTLIEQETKAGNKIPTDLSQYGVSFRFQSPYEQMTVFLDTNSITRMYKISRALYMRFKSMIPDIPNNWADMFRNAAQPSTSAHYFPKEPTSPQNNNDIMGITNVALRAIRVKAIDDNKDPNHIPPPNLTIPNPVSSGSTSSTNQLIDFFKDENNPTSGVSYYYQLVAEPSSNPSSRNKRSMYVMLHTLTATYLSALFGNISSPREIDLRRYVDNVVVRHLNAKAARPDSIPEDSSPGDDVIILQDKKYEIKMTVTTHNAKMFVIPNVIESPQTIRSKLLFYAFHNDQCVTAKRNNYLALKNQFLREFETLQCTCCLHLDYTGDVRQINALIRNETTQQKLARSRWCKTADLLRQRVATFKEKFGSSYGDYTTVMLYNLLPHDSATTVQLPNNSSGNTTMSTTSDSTNSNRPGAAFPHQNKAGMFMTQQQLNAMNNSPNNNTPNNHPNSPRNPSVSGHDSSIQVNIGQHMINTGNMASDQIEKINKIYAMAAMNSMNPGQQSQGTGKNQSKVSGVNHVNSGMSASGLLPSGMNQANPSPIPAPPLVSEHRPTTTTFFGSLPSVGQDTVRNMQKGKQYFEDIAQRHNIITFGPEFGMRAQTQSRSGQDPSANLAVSGFVFNNRYTGYLKLIARFHDGFIAYKRATARHIWLSNKILYIYTRYLDLVLKTFRSQHETNQQSLTATVILSSSSNSLSAQERTILAQAHHQFMTALPDNYRHRLNCLLRENRYNSTHALYSQFIQWSFANSQRKYAHRSYQILQHKRLTAQHKIFNKILSDLLQPNSINPFSADYRKMLSTMATKSTPYNNLNNPDSPDGDRLVQRIIDSLNMMALTPAYPGLLVLSPADRKNRIDELSKIFYLLMNPKTRNEPTNSHPKSMKPPQTTATVLNLEKTPEQSPILENDSLKKRIGPSSSTPLQGHPAHQQSPKLLTDAAILSNIDESTTMYETGELLHNPRLNMPEVVDFCPLHNPRVSLLIRYFLSDELMYLHSVLTNTDFSIQTTRALHNCRLQDIKKLREYISLVLELKAPLTDFGEMSQQMTQQSKNHHKDKRMKYYAHPLTQAPTPPQPHWILSNQSIDSMNDRQLTYLKTLVTLTTSLSHKYHQLSQSTLQTLDHFTTPSNKLQPGERANDQNNNIFLGARTENRPIFGIHAVKTPQSHSSPKISNRITISSSPPVTPHKALQHVLSTISPLYPHLFRPFFLPTQHNDINNNNSALFAYASNHDIINSNIQHYAHDFYTQQLFASVLPFHLRLPPFPTFPHQLHQQILQEQQLLLFKHFILYVSKAGGFKTFVEKMRQFNHQQQLSQYQPKLRTSSELTMTDVLSTKFFNAKDDILILPTQLDDSALNSLTVDGRKNTTTPMQEQVRQMGALLRALQDPTILFTQHVPLGLNVLHTWLSTTEDRIDALHSRYSSGKH